MTEVSDFFQVTLGVSSLGAVVLLALKLLQVMTRHNVLLAGQCVAALAEKGQGECKEKPLRRYRYRLRLQNLEAADADHRLCVTIRGVPSGSHVLSKPLDRVLALVGWKPIDVKQDLGRRRDPYRWVGEFQELPAFDTWSFDVVLPCERVQFSVSFVGVKPSLWIGPRFGPYFATESLTVYSSDRDDPRVRGPVTAPAVVVPVILSVLAIAAHTLWVSMSGWRIGWQYLAAKDTGLIALEIFLIWLGYAAIRRPVYPVVSGYRFITPAWSEDDAATRGDEDDYANRGHVVGGQ